MLLKSQLCRQHSSLLQLGIRAVFRLGRLSCQPLLVSSAGHMLLELGFGVDVDFTDVTVESLALDADAPLVANAFGFVQCPWEQSQPAPPVVAVLPL